MKYRIVEFDPGSAPEDLLERYFDFEDRMFRELEAKDPLPLRERRREAIGDTNPQRKVFRWVVIGDIDGREEVIGESEIAFVTEEDADYGEYGHIAGISLGVDGRFRRQGLGTELLGALVEKAVEHGHIRTLETFGFQESGWRFCDRFGGKVALEAAQYRLELAAADWEMLASWRLEGAERNKGTTLSIFSISWGSARAAFPVTGRALCCSAARLIGDFCHQLSRQQMRGIAAKDPDRPQQWNTGTLQLFDISSKRCYVVHNSPMPDSWATLESGSPSQLLPPPQDHQCVAWSARCCLSSIAFDEMSDSGVIQVTTTRHLE